MTTNSNDRRWRAGYRAGVQDAIEALRSVSIWADAASKRSLTNEEVALWLKEASEHEVKKLFLVNPRGPDEGAAKRYGIKDD